MINMAFFLSAGAGIMDAYSNLKDTYKQFYNAFLDVRIKASSILSDKYPSFAHVNEIILNNNEKMIAPGNSNWHEQLENDYEQLRTFASENKKEAKAPDFQAFYLCYGSTVFQSDADFWRSSIKEQEETFNTLTDDWFSAMVAIALYFSDYDDYRSRVQVAKQSICLNIPVCPIQGKKIPEGDPNSVRPLLVNIASYSHGVLNSDSLRDIVDDPNITFENNPRQVMRFMVAALMSSPEYLQGLESSGRYTLANAIRSFMEESRRQNAPMIGHFIDDLQGIIGNGNDVHATSLLATQIALEADESSYLALSVFYLDRIIPGGMNEHVGSFLAYIQILGIIFPALWICDYCGFRKIYEELGSSSATESSNTTVSSEKLQYVPKHSKPGSTRNTTSQQSSVAPRKTKSSPNHSASDIRKSVDTSSVYSDGSVTMQSAKMQKTVNRAPSNRSNIHNFSSEFEAVDQRLNNGTYPEGSYQDWLVKAGCSTWFKMVFENQDTPWITQGNMSLWHFSFMGWKAAHEVFYQNESFKTYQLLKEQVEKMAALAASSCTNEYNAFVENPCNGERTPFDGWLLEHFQRDCDDGETACWDYCLGSDGKIYVISVIENTRRNEFEYKVNEVTYMYSDLLKPFRENCLIAVTNGWIEALDTVPAGDPAKRRYTVRDGDDAYTFNFPTSLDVSNYPYERLEGLQIRLESLLKNGSTQQADISYASDSAKKTEAKQNHVGAVVHQRQYEVSVAIFEDDIQSGVSSIAARLYSFYAENQMHMNAMVCSYSMLPSQILQYLTEETGIEFNKSHQICIHPIDNPDIVQPVGSYMMMQSYAHRFNAVAFRVGQGYNVFKELTKFNDEKIKSKLIGTNDQRLGVIDGTAQAVFDSEEVDFDYEDYGAVTSDTPVWFEHEDAFISYTRDSESVSNSSSYPSQSSGVPATAVQTQNRISRFMQTTRSLKVLNIVYLANLAVLFMNLFNRDFGSFAFLMFVEISLRVAICYFTCQKYSAIWEIGNFKFPIGITSYGVAGFLISMLGCLFKGHLLLALVFLSAREVIKYILIRRATADKK